MANKTGTPTFTEAMNGPHSAGFLKATELEIATPIEMKTFDVIPCTSKLDIISSVRAFQVNNFLNWVSQEI